MGSDAGPFRAVRALSLGGTVAGRVRRMCSPWLSPLVVADQTETKESGL